jgi:nucleotide-binding universal stress UspA family protein
MTSTTSQSPVVVGYQDHHSIDALEWACQEAARRGAPVRVVHAYAREQLYPWGYGYPLPVGDLATVEEKMRTRASTLLEEAADGVRTRHPELPLTATLAGSSPDAGLVTASQDATLLVVGRHERPPRGASHGSVSLSVAAHAACPVVVVPSPPAEEASAADAGGSGEIEVVAHAGPPPPLGALFAGQVVVGVDDSPEAADAVGFAFAQASARGVGLVALHAWWVDPILLAPSMPVDWNEMGAADQGAIDGLLAPWRARCPDVKVTRILARMSTAEALVTASSEAELLVVGSRGRGGFARLLLGSVSRKVLQHSRCPLAVVRRGQLAALHDLALS